MTCQQCGANLVPGDAFCGECGQASVREAPVRSSGRARINLVRLILLVVMVLTAAAAAYFKVSADAPVHWEPRYAVVEPHWQLRDLEGSYKIRENNRCLKMALKSLYSEVFLAAEPEPGNKVLLRRAGDGLEGSITFKDGKNTVIRGEVAEDRNSMVLHLEDRVYHLERVSP